jgi:hypothetical protein
LQDLKYVRAAKEICITILIGDVQVEARLYSLSKVLNYARSIAEYRFESKQSLKEDSKNK